MTLLSGCGTDTSPSGSILNEINERKISNQDNVAKIIKDYYAKALKSIKDDKCNSLSTESSSIIDQSIVELSKKNCSNPTGLKTEIQKVLAKVNSAKSMKLTINLVDDTQDWIAIGWSIEQAEELKSYGLTLDVMSGVKIGSMKAA